MRLSMKSLILYLWRHAFSCKKQTLHTGTVKLGQGDKKAMVSAWLWCQNPVAAKGRKAPMRVQTQASGGNPRPHERQWPCLCQAQ